jgi:hypothetical protein
MDTLLNNESASKNERFTFKVTKNKTYKAVFTKKSLSSIRYTINATSENESIGNVAGDGRYRKGSEATLTAIPKDGFEFLRWETPEGTLSNEKEFSFTVNDNYNIVARFKEKENPNKERYTVNIKSNYSGAINEIYTYQTDTGMISDDFTEDDKVTIRVTNIDPNLNNENLKEKVSYKYIGLYDGDELLTTDFIYDFTIEKDMSLVAKFTPISIDNFTIINDQSNAMSNLEVPEKFNRTSISPNKKYILGIDEEYIYIINSSDNSLHIAYKISELSNDASFTRILWNSQSDGFLFSDDDSLIIQSLDSSYIKIKPPKFRGVYSIDNFDEWPNNSRIVEKPSHSAKLYLSPFMYDNNYMGISTGLAGMYQSASFSLSFIDLESLDKFTKKFTRLTSHEGLPYYPGGAKFNKDKTKFLYSVNNGFLPKRQPSTLTGFFNIKKQEDFDIDIDNLGNHPEIPPFSVHGTPLIWLNENHILFRFIPHLWYPSSEHLYVLDIKNNEIVFLRNDQSINTTLPIEIVGESDKYEGMILCSSYSNTEDTSTIYLSDIVLDSKELTQDALKEMPKEYNDSYSPENDRKFLLSRYDSYYNLESENLFTLEDDLIIRDVFTDSNNNLIITLSYSFDKSRAENKNKYYLVTVDRNKNHEVVYESNEQFKAINVEKDSFTIIKDNKIQRIDR